MKKKQQIQTPRPGVSGLEAVKTVTRCRNAKSLLRTRYFGGKKKSCRLQWREVRWRTWEDAGDAVTRVCDYGLWPGSVSINGGEDADGCVSRVGPHVGTHVTCVTRITPKRHVTYFCIVFIFYSTFLMNSLRQCEPKVRTLILWATTVTSLCHRILLLLLLLLWISVHSRSLNDPQLRPN